MYKFVTKCKNKEAIPSVYEIKKTQKLLDTDLGTTTPVGTSTGFICIQKRKIITLLSGMHVGRNLDSIEESTGDKRKCG